MLLKDIIVLINSCILCRERLNGVVRAQGATYLTKNNLKFKAMVPACKQRYKETLHHLLILTVIYILS